MKTHFVALSLLAVAACDVPYEVGPAAGAAGAPGNSAAAGGAGGKSGVSGGSAGGGGSAAGVGGANAGGAGIAGASGAGIAGASGAGGNPGAGSGGSAATGGAAAWCGDKIKNGSEACDGVDIGAASCVSVTGNPSATGTPVCTSACALSANGCAAPSCGDGVKNGTEQCDKSDFGSATCATATGYAQSTGALACAGSCTVDSAACSAAPTCGDGVKNGAEACDGAIIGGATCASVTGNAAATGTVTCQANCTFEQSGCTVPTCGDGVKNGTEACDGSDFGEATCQSVTGQPNGALACNGCVLVTTGCSGVASGSPSCATPLDCGGVSCCDAQLVPGGTFWMGRSAAGTDADLTADGGGYSAELPEHSVTVSAFRLDTFEVTVGRFRKYVDSYLGPPAAGAGLHPKVAGTGWDAEWNASMPATSATLKASLKCESTYQTWTDTEAGNERKPVNCVSWFAASAFCAWDGGHLPTEAEWEFASAGGDENRLHPWGAAAPTMALAAYACLFSGSGSPCEAADLPVAGSVPAGNARWGHRDLAGSLWEWTYDLYDSSWYSGAGAVCNDCANSDPTNGARVMRGGNFRNSTLYLRAAYRHSGLPANRHDLIGFRCARTPLAN